MSERPDENLVRKLSETVLRASQRQKRGLFEKLTSANADKIAKLSKERPTFRANRPESPQTLLIDENIAGLLPDSFFEDPSGWIESQNVINRGDNHALPTGESIEELWTNPYDITKVREFSLTSDSGKQIRIISKRIESTEIEEIVRARIAYEAGVPTPQVLAEIADKGNMYAFFEYIPALNMMVVVQKTAEKLKRKFKLNDSLDIILRNAPFELLIDPHTESIEQQFENLPFLSEQEKADIRELAKKAKAAWDKDTSIEVLMPVIPRSREYVPTGVDIARKRIRDDLRMGNRKKLGGVLHDLEYDDIERYLADLGNPEIASSMETRLTEMRNEAKGEFRKAEWQCAGVLWRSILGFNYLEEIENLEDMIEESGLEHKDLERRNVLLRWDFEKDEPLLDAEDGKFLYVIDWETAKKSRVRIQKNKHH